ncbi:MAG: holo-ACP synthase [OCS116 cluster bacterium]|uniref:Holo-[acyl-carrier-protein] synthase n=1 Tax=OCS116 cluster bacterium TaxID=2030921 RepID=A0A2A4YR88_9PROT|nr:holo-ACP synthase [OCS116 cluster bacterium]
MIIGIGTDIVEINRIARSVEKFGDKFLARTFSTDELEQAKKLNDPTAYYAKRFAAKEAFAKAIGTGIGHAAAFKDISTLNNEQGTPYIELAGDAATFIKNLQKTNGDRVASIHVSLSDEKQYAQAFVILELI